MEETNSISAQTFTFDSLRLRLIFGRATFYLKPHLAKRLVAPRLLVDHQCLGNFLIHQFTSHPTSPSIVCLNFAPIAENQFFIFLNLIFFPIYFLLLLIVYFNFFFSECHPCLLTDKSPLSSAFQLIHCIVSLNLDFSLLRVFQANFFIICFCQANFFIIFSFKLIFSYFFLLSSKLFHFWLMIAESSRAKEFPPTLRLPPDGKQCSPFFFSTRLFLVSFFSF